MPPRKIPYSFTRVDDVWCRLEPEGEPERVEIFCARLVERGMGDAADAFRGLLRSADNYNAKRFTVQLQGVKWSEPDYSTEEPPEQVARRSRLDEAEERLAMLEASVKGAVERMDAATRAAEQAVERVARADGELQALALELRTPRPEAPGPNDQRIARAEASFNQLDGAIADLRGGLDTLRAEVAAYAQSTAKRGARKGSSEADVKVRVEALDERVDRVLSTLDHERRSVEAMRARVDNLDQRTHGPVHADAVAKALMDDLRRATEVVRKRVEEHVAGTPRHVIERVSEIVREAGLQFEAYVPAMTAWVEHRKERLAPSGLLERFGDGTTASELSVLVGLVVVEAGLDDRSEGGPEDLVIRLFRDAYAQRPELPEAILAPLTHLCAEARLEPILPGRGGAFNGALHVVEGACEVEGVASGAIARLVSPGFRRAGGGEILEPASVLLAE